MYLMLLLTACSASDDAKDTAPVVDTGPAPIDADGDGVPAGADCDDTDEYSYPGAPEVPYDGEDQDCDGADVNDVDGDGYIGDNGGGDDCNDANPDVHPDAAIVCYDLIDEDCSPGWTQYDCDSDGYVVTEDCGDENPDIYPGAPDVWYDGVDSDCDERRDFDQDEDGFDSDAYSDGGEPGHDCDDTNPLVHPEADEVWDRSDNDCDGDVDQFNNREATASWNADVFLAEEQFANDITPLPDLDGDGAHEVLVGVVGAAEFIGTAYVLPYRDGLQIPGDTALATIGGTTGYLGSTVTSLEIAGETWIAVAEAGALQVLLFPASALTGGVSLTASDARATVTNGTYYLGGDLAEWDDGSGDPSLMISSYEVADLGSSVSVHAGSALIGAVDDADARWTWTATGDAYDAAVLSDLDGDGLPEIGMSSTGFGDAAWAYVAAGDAVRAGATDTDIATVKGLAGHAILHGFDDLLGDGYGALALSDWQAEGNATAAGKIWIVSGPDALVGGEVADLAVATVSGDIASGALRAGTGLSDMNDDGTADLLACSPGLEDGGVYAGCSWISGLALLGGGALSLGTEAPLFTSASPSDQFGTDIVPDDIDGDGDDDLWVTSPGNTGKLLAYLRY